MHQVNSMVDFFAVKDILLDIPYISNITIQEGRYYKSKGFAKGINCDILVRDKCIGLFVGIPDSWERELVSIFITDTLSLPFMPHIEPDGRICLFDLEGVLIDFQFEGLLKQCLQRAKDILEDGFFADNRHEFAREFPAYWAYQKNGRYMKFAVPESHSTSIFKYSDAADSITRKENESFAAFHKRQKTAVLFGAQDPLYFSSWKNPGQQRNGLYCHIRPAEYILPPDPKKSLTFDFLQYLCSNINESDFVKKCRRLNNTFAIIFEVDEPGNENITFGMLAHNVTFFESNGRISAQYGHNSSIIPLNIERIDEAYLRRRTDNCDKHSPPKCLLIGCGSIGSYLFPELIKSGWKDITLVDNDILSEENIFRHCLGIEYVGKYKTVALIEYCQRNLLARNCTSLEEKIEDIVEENSIDLSDYDIIISATGNHNTNRWLNRWIINHHIPTPCIYLWNEPLDIGCHLAIISARYSGCYECFFDRNENGELFDATAYSSPGQIITRNDRGCTGSYVPYASNVSLKTVSECMEWIERIQSNRCNENILVSVKGDGYFFIQSGLKCSEVYKNQTCQVKVLRGTDFEKNTCGVCGGKSDNTRRSI